jgi:hypothetical protein
MLKNIPSLYPLYQRSISPSVSKFLLIFYIHLIFHISLPGKYAVMANFHLCFAVIVRTFFSGDEIYVHLKQDTPMYYRNSTSLSFYNPFTGILDGVTPYPQCTIGALFRMHSTGESPDLIVPDDWQLTLQLFR